MDLVYLRHSIYVAIKERKREINKWMHYQLGNMCKSRYIIYQWMIWIMYAGIMVKPVSLVILICEVISVLSRFVMFLKYIY